MINLFHIPSYNVDTSTFDHLLHGSIVEELEKNFCQYVGAKYACSVSSATNAIFLALLHKNLTITIPSVIPPVVGNAILTSGNKINFTDDVGWVGNSYILHQFKDYKIIDSAQKVERNQFYKEANDEDLIIFSFYPTKPVGSCDGGMIVSNDLKKIQWFKEATLNGMAYSPHNWERQIKFAGFKMYMNSLQCFIANQNLKKLDLKKRKLKEIREVYNSELRYTNTSDHLYRIGVKNNKHFMKHMKEKEISCGIHYAALHENPIYNHTNQRCARASLHANQTISIPFHENLKMSEIEYIINHIKLYKEKA